MFAGVFVGRAFKKNSYLLPESETTAKAIGFLPTITAILLLIALVFGIKLGENGAFCKEVNFAQWELSAKFSSVTFDVLWHLSIIICASITNLVLNQYKFDFEIQLFLF